MCIKENVYSGYCHNLKINLILERNIYLAHAYLYFVLNSCEL